MLRQGRLNIICSGTVTFSAGTTATAALTLSLSMPASAGTTTWMHEVILTTNCTGNISADIRAISTINGSTFYGDISASITIPGVAISKGLSVGAIHTRLRGLFTGNSNVAAFLLSSSATATITVNCIVQEFEGI